MYTILDSTSLWALLHDGIYTKFQEVSFPWGKRTNNVRKKFPSLGSFTHFLWNVWSSLCIHSMKCHHYVKYFWYDYQRSALCWILLYIMNSFKPSTYSCKQLSFGDVRYMTEESSASIFSHRMGYLDGEAEHMRMERVSAEG